MHVASDFGLTVSLPKTKVMVIGRGITDADKTSIHLEGAGEVEYVSQFSYLGSVTAESGRMSTDNDKRIAQASRTFGSLRKCVFADKDLSLQTKRRIYQACVLSALLYGSECWTPLKKDMKRLDSFHHRCIRIVLGITNQQQWEQHITSQEIRQRWGDLTTVTAMVTARRLEWLGHLARMPTTRTPRKCLFG